MLPLTLAAAVAAILVGRISARFGLPVPLAGGIMLIGASLLSLGIAAPDGQYLVIALALIGVGAGAGLALTASSDAIISSVSPGKAGGAAAISETGYELGTALGVAVLGSVMNAVYRSTIDDLPGADAKVMDAARESLPTAAEVSSTLPADVGAALLDIAQRAFLDGLEATTMIGAVVMACVSLGAWLLLKPRPVSQKEPAQVAAG